MPLVAAAAGDELLAACERELAAVALELPVDRFAVDLVLAEPLRLEPDELLRERDADPLLDVARAFVPPAALFRAA